MHILSKKKQNFLLHQFRNSVINKMFTIIIYEFNSWQWQCKLQSKLSETCNGSTFYSLCIVVSSTLYPESHKIRFIFFYFSVMPSAFRSIDKYCLARIQYNVSEWSDMSTRELHNCSSIKIQLGLFVHYIARTSPKRWTPWQASLYRWYDLCYCILAMVMSVHCDRCSKTDVMHGVPSYIV